MVMFCFSFVTLKQRERRDFPAVFSNVGSISILVCILSIGDT